MSLKSRKHHAGNQQNAQATNAVAISGLSKEYSQFSILVAKGTGLSPRVIGAWCLAEGGPSYNPLNIGPGNSYDGVAGGAKATIDLLGQSLYKGIMASVGKSDAVQINAIASSPWLTGQAGPHPDYENLIKGTYQRVGSLSASQLQDIIGTNGTGIPGVDQAKDLINSGADVVDFVGDFVSTILNFRKFGELLAKVLAWFLKVVLQAIWEYVIAPLVHWNERATDYYWQAYFGREKALLGSDSFFYKNAGWVTLTFWSFGYGILWAKVEKNASGNNRLALAGSPRESMLGRTIAATQKQASKRHVTSAEKHAKQQAEAKPAQVFQSTTPIQQTRTLTVTRRRPVGVSQGGRRESAGVRRTAPTRRIRSGRS